MNRKALLRYWTERWIGDPPAILSVDIIRRAVIWRLQVEAAGGLPIDLKQFLKRYERAKAAGTGRNRPILDAPSVGLIFSRIWKGKKHKVEVVEDGFAYAGITYRTLSGVAFAITGVSWSGPRFFDVEGRRSISYDDLGSEPSS